MEKDLKGLLLVGGKSSRMGTDKAQLVYRDNLPEWQRLSALMLGFCGDVYVCCQQDQAKHFDLPVVIDRGNGPLEAIAEADIQIPDHAWLVVACDLPLLDSDTLKTLINARKKEVVGTYYTSVFDGKPEPLCAIYETSMFPKIHDSLAKQHFCPRKLLSQHDGNALSLQNPLALKNANTPAEKLEIEAILAGNSSVKKVSIRYFAQLKEIAEMDSEVVETQSITPAGLYEELQIKHQFPHKAKQLMVAINDDFSEWDAHLQAGDEVVFIPPVAGG